MQFFSRPSPFIFTAVALQRVPLGSRLRIERETLFEAGRHSDHGAIPVPYIFATCAAGLGDKIISELGAMMGSAVPGQASMKVCGVVSEKRRENPWTSNMCKFALYHLLFNYVDTIAKCRHLKKFTCKGNVWQVCHQSL